MKKVIVSLSFILCLQTVAFAQIPLDKGIYKVNFSNALHEPRYVSYFLYRGGGDCDRASFRFKNDEPGLQCATPEDYKGSHYDKGHLANAEDFAFNCEEDELTFRYYNCLPQTPNLNRGKWKVIETQVRKWSQTEKLYIICGGYFGSVKIGDAAVPSCCWKVVQSVATKKVLFCAWFTNSSDAEMEKISVSELESRLHSHIVLLK